jgi:16S rRNA (cytosine967-C5)-methyltransferase
LDVLRRVFTQGAFASILLRNTLEQHADLSGSDRALVTELVYGVLRRRGHLDRALTKAAKKRLKDLDPRLHDVLRLGAYQLMFLDRVPDHAAVSEAVEQAKVRLGPRGGNQTNAILRNLAATPPDARLSTPPSFEKEPARHVQEVGGIPLALAEILVRDLGADRALAFVKASLLIAPLTLRANRLKTTREALRSEVGGEPGIHPWSVRLPAGGGVLPADLLPVEEGRATPQDEASMMVVDLVAAEPNERILDVCSAPGGKTTMIAEVMNDTGSIVAHDRLPERLLRTKNLADRLGLRSITTRDILPRADDPPFDRVLVDAPCSGLGTLRRHPEIRWRFEPEQLESLAQVQRSVLEDGMKRVRVGGVLIYSVCTVTRAEGEDRVQSLDGFERIGALFTSPADPGAPDGFFAAKFVRRR